MQEEKRSSRRSIRIRNARPYMHDLADLALLKAKMQEADIFCDATGVGMHPLEDLSNIPDPSYFRKDLIVTDTVMHRARPL